MIAKIKILTINNMYKCISLDPSFGGNQAYRNGVTPIMLDIFMQNNKIKNRISYYHDGTVEIFLQYTYKWLESWYIACKNNHYMWQSMAFSPSKPDNITDTQIYTFEKYKDLEKFLQEFFNE